MPSFENVRMDQVGFPSQKVYLFDLFDRHSQKKVIFHAYDIAKQPLLFFDGSVSYKKTGDANKGWNPRLPNGMGPNAITRYRYWPTPGEPDTLSGSESDEVIGYYRWTRNGIKGVDYGGGEVMR
jgi:hypothetical protein